MALQFEVDQEVEEFVDSIPQLMTEPPWSYNDTLVTGQTVSIQPQSIRCFVVIYLLSRLLSFSILSVDMHSIRCGLMSNVTVVAWSVA